MIPEDPAERHRAVAATFGARVRGVTDWAAPAPVPGWTAADVVAHLIDWSTGFLAGGGVRLPDAAGTDSDPAARWAAHAAAIQALLDGPAAGAEFRHPRAGTHVLASAIDRFYTSDVFMHTWDLAQASGQASGLDADEAERLLGGLRPIEQVLRDSGQYGPAMPVADDAPAVDRLMAFVGRRV